MYVDTPGYRAQRFARPHSRWGNKEMIDIFPQVDEMIRRVERLLSCSRFAAASRLQDKIDLILLNAPLG